MNNFHEPFLPGQNSKATNMPDLPFHPDVIANWEEDKKKQERAAAARKRRRSVPKKVLKQNALAQPRKADGRFAGGGNFVTRLLQVAQGKHRSVIKSSRANEARMTRQHRNKMYREGYAVIPLQKKTRRRKKPVQETRATYRKSVLSSLLPWNWGKK